MPANDPTSRGKPRNFKRLTDPANDEPTQLRMLREVMEPEELVDLLQELIDVGYALTIGRTRDGGAISLAFMVGGKPIKRYTASRDAWLSLLAEFSD